MSIRVAALGVAASVMLLTGCTRSEAMRWAQMSPTIERTEAPNITVQLGAKRDTPDVIDARLP